MSAPLYALTGAYQQLLELAEEGEDIADALAQLDDAIEAKALGIVKVLAQLDANAEAASAEAERLAARAKAFANNAERLREYVKAHMKAANIKSVKTPLFSIALSNGKPKVVITDVGKVPPELMRHPEPPPAQPDKVAILKLHKDTGEIPPGCDIVATTQLRVR
jgi:hypothetical protein